MTSRSPLETIEAQLHAYNAKNVDALLDCYAPDAEQCTVGGELLAKGHAALRVRFLQRFAEPDLHAKLLTRSVIGNVVVDTELITRNYPEGRGTIEYLGVYEISDGRIQRVRVAFGEQVLWANDNR
jgi:hypothetical protein